MTGRIWKFPLRASGGDVMAPHGATALTVQLQQGTPTLWMLVPEGPMDTRYTFEIFATGDRVPEGLEYISTYSTLAGGVFHAFKGAS